MSSSTLSSKSFHTFKRSTIVDNDMDAITNKNNLINSSGNNGNSAEFLFASQSNNIMNSSSMRRNDQSLSSIRSTAVKSDDDDDDNESQKPKRRITASVKETGFDSMKYYMKTMGNHELLKKNEEIILAREIQILIKWEEERENLEAKLMR